MSRRDVSDVDQQLRMTSFLGEVGYRDLAPNSNGLRLTMARRLWRDGVDDRLLRLLWQYAQVSSKTPLRLFCWWLDNGRFTAKIDEMRAKEGWVRRVLEHVVAAEPSEDWEAPIIPIRKAP